MNVFVLLELGFAVNVAHPLEDAVLVLHLVGEGDDEPDLDEDIERVPVRVAPRLFDTAAELLEDTETVLVLL
jgi:hypothetical protein